MGGHTTIHKKQSLDLVASTSTDSSDVPLRDSSREEGNASCDKTKQVKRLYWRLRIAEEETKMLKAVFWVAIQEKRKLMREVHEQVRNCLMFRDQEGRQTVSKASTIKFSEEREAGMLQLLPRDSNRLLLNRSISIEESTYVPTTRTDDKNFRL